MPVASSPSFQLQPSAYRVPGPTNYIGSTAFDFTNQYLPDIYEKEFERYGNRSISGFLRMVGAEMPCASDLIRWAEQGRLHVKYTGCSFTAFANGGGTLRIPASQFAASLGSPTATNANPLSQTNFGVRIGQTLVLQQENGTKNFHGIISAISYTTGGNINQDVTINLYEDTTTVFPATTNEPYTIWVYGSEFKKGTLGMAETLQPFDLYFANNPVIIKDRYTVTGSDMTQIGWVEVTTENGASGYLWYMKAEHESRLRFEDYLEATVIEAVPAVGTASANAGNATQGFKGTEGVFYAVQQRGNIFSGGFPTSLVDFDAIVQRLDKQGAIEENALFVNRAASFAMDDFLAAQNSYGTGGTSYGLFDNSEQMALNLGFRGFRRGYDFYKTDWKYLNDPTMRGQGTATGTVGGAINGLLVPAGTTNVYDEVMGQNAKRPFLHVRYRETEAESRKFKTWAIGSAGGAANSDSDSMSVHYLSERCVCTLGANNFFIFQS